MSQQDVLVHNFAFAIVIPLGVGIFEAITAALGSAVVTAGVSLAVKAISDSASQQMDQHILDNPYIKNEGGKDRQIGNPLPHAMAQEVARQLGYPIRKPPFNGIDSRGEPVYMDEKQREGISYDNTGHGGSTWKKFKKIGNKWEREGTYDQNMKKIRD